MTEQNSSEPKKRSRIKLAIAGFLSLILLSIVLVASGIYFLPQLLEMKAREFIAENFNRELTVGKIDIDLSKLTLKLDDVKLTDAGKKSVFASFDHLFLALSPETFTEFDPVVKEVRLVNPTVNLVRTSEKHSNIDDMVAFLNKPGEEDRKTNFSINNIRIENGVLRFNDELRKKQLLVEDLNVGIPFIANISSEVDLFVPLEISARVNKDKIALAGRSKPARNRKSGTIGIKLEKIDIPTWLGYFPVDPGFKLKSGKFSADLDITFAKKEGDRRGILVEGDIALDSLWLTESNQANVLKLAELKIGIDKSDIFSGKLNLGRIGVKNPVVFLDRNPNGQWNVERLLSKLKKNDVQTINGKTGKTADTVPTQKKATAKRPLVVSLNQFAVSDARFFITDKTYKVPVQISAKNIGLNVEKLVLDMDRHDVSVDKVLSTGTRIQFIHSMPELLDKFKSPDKDKIASDAATQIANESGFHFHIRQAAIRNWFVYLENRHAEKPVVTTVSQLEVTAENLSDSLTSSIPLSAKARINDRGTYVVKGNVTISPLKADLDVDVQNVDVRFIQPYIDDYVNLSLQQADLSLKGKLLLKQTTSGTLEGQFTGGAAISRLAAVDQLSRRPVISWKDLAFEGVAIKLNPLSVTIDKARMTDVVARVILLADGRLNLQNILRSRAGGQKSLTENEGEPLAITSPAADVLAVQDNRSEKKPAQVSVPKTVPVQTSASQEKPDFSIAFGKWFIKNGSVRFSDNFIKPRYTANIRNLRGAFINLSNDPATQSRIRLRGQVNGAPLDISGYINPLSEQLKLNIKAQVTGMELAQFSAYSGKYLGYGIDKGKLTYKATYQVQNGVLTAENSLILDQLTLGEKVDSEETISSSIELALALLKDSDGVIDINVPIAGSLNDPEFSLGSIVGKVILNTLKRIVTAPFAWLSSLSEHEKGLSAMIFEPGSAILPKDSEKRLERMAKGLAKRPKIKLEITGLYDDVADKEGLGQSTLDRKVRELKRKKAGIPSFDQVIVSEKEYPELIKEIYKNEKFDKPKALFVFDKTIPVAEMEQLLIRHYASRNNNLVLLANRRAEAVKNWLVLKGKLPEERIYLLASKKGSAEKDLPAHRVEFNLRWKN